MIAFTILLALVNSSNMLCRENRQLIETLRARYMYGGRPATVRYLEDIDCYEIRKSTDDVLKYVEGLCDNTGKELIPPTYYLIHKFYLKDYPFCEVRSHDGKHGMYDIKKGREIVPVVFDDINLDYKESYKGEIMEFPKFYVEKNNKWGLYSSAGGEIIPTIYDSVKHIKDDDCKVTSGDKSTIFDLFRKKESFPLKYNDITRIGYSREFAQYKVDNKSGLLSLEKQQELTEAKYFELKPYGVNFIKCIDDGKEGLLDYTGKELIPPKYSFVKPVGDSICIVIDGISFDESYDIIRNGKWGAYNLRTGEMIVAPKYDYISQEITENIIKCNIGGKPADMMTVTGGLWGCIDLAGNEVVPFDYETIGRFDKGVAQVKINGAIGLIENPLSGTSLQFASHQNSPVDVNIPDIGKRNNETFAFIIANENYPEFDASYAVRDGETMAKYCEKRLGIPQKNIMVYNDATYGTMQSMLLHCYDIADVYEGDADFIIYFSGIGLMNNGEKDCYLLPVDASMANVKSTSISINELLGYFGGLNVNNLLLITDCPFNGVDRAGNNLTQNRGVAIRQDFTLPDGEMTWISTSHTSRQKSIDKDTHHGILTYSILEILQKERSVALSDLTAKVVKSVKEKTLEINGEAATPEIKNNNKKKDLKDLKI